MGNNKDSSKWNISIDLRKLRIFSSKTDKPKTLEKSNNSQILIMGPSNKADSKNLSYLGFYDNDIS